ncbi:MAG TPA: phage tail sheath C-terminal domain-containing protein [Candidatus Angelobacter sp.]
MPQYLSPGVYIEEQDTGPEPIEGVSTSVTGFVGVAQMGPLDTNPPVLVTSFPEFQRIFGSYFTPGFTAPSNGDSYNLLPHAVAGFFNNGGQLLYIKRVANALTPPAFASVSNLENNVGSPTIMTRLTTTAVPLVTSTIFVENMRGIQNGAHITLTQVKNGVTSTSGSLTVASYNDSQNSVTFTAPLPAPTPAATNYDWQYTTVALTSGAPFVPAPNTSEFLLNASSPGLWGNTVQTQGTGLQVEITPSSRTQAQVIGIGNVAPGTNNLILLNSALNFYAGAILEFNTGGGDTVAGSVTSGTFTVGEQVVQTSTGATAYVLATVPAAGPMTIGGLTGTPDGTHTWTGASSGAVFTPTAAPAAVSGGKFYAKVLNVTGSGVQLTAGLTGTEPTAINENLTAKLPVTVRTCEFDINAFHGTVSESFRGLTLDNNTPYYYATAILNGSSLLSVPLLPTVPPHTPWDNTTPDPSTMPVAPDGQNVQLTGGTDGATPTFTDFGGNDGGPGNRTGIAALIDASEVSIIAAPGVSDQNTQMALITQCETLKYRFAILDPAPTSTGGTPSMTNIQNQRSLYDTLYAAIYYPRVVVTDPLSGNPLAICPSGHMAGIYAQTDAARGVWKAPANIVINGILSLETKLSKGDQDILNPEPNNINALRDFTKQDRGLRVYGARCITSNEEWKYINVRRLFIFIEASLDEGTQWAVFEPNDQQLWNRLIQSVSSFLSTIWQQGGLMGATADQAYFVKCGLDTMSQDDIDNGRLIMLVGVAPVFPAEFVIIRIGQWAGGSSVQEL